jgi:glycosyltransferase involved in cell wall biosynthesis
VSDPEGWPDPPPPVAAPAALPPAPRRAPIKVLHVITRFIAGAGGNTLLTALGTDRDRYEVWVAGAAGGPLWKRAADAGVRTVELPRFREVISPLDDLAVLAQLIRLIRRERFSIVHTHSTKGGVLGRLAAWICRTPIVVHTIHGFSTHEFMSRARRRAYLAFERPMRPLTDSFLAVAPEVAREAVDSRLAPPGGVSVVPSAVELDAIPAGGDPRIRLELGISADASLIGTVGRVDEQKAPLDFVRAAAMVAEERPAARFVVVGDGPLLEAARAEAKRLGVEVAFTGFREDAAIVAATFDVFVISSLYEGLGRALTEALASARPVVATAVNGVVDLVEHGSTGLLAAPHDPESLARAVTWMLDHPTEAARMGAAGATRVRQTFRPEVMCRQIDDIYARLLGLPRRGGVAEPAGESALQPPEAGAAERASSRTRRLS